MAPAISVTGALETRTNPAQVSAVGRSSVDNKSTSAAAAVPPQKTAFSRFSFRVEDYDDDENEEKEIEIDKHTFSKMLRKVSLAEAKLYAQMSYLGSLAYAIPKIKVTTNKP
ncbi:hypothetical protein COLO4_23255 [Corchorus olitorius]|uniref:Uncharacterized protein n=1 Tax=Corchorus olitorius TaxID=93759 RepID=A0A1R3IHL8_9ROSI|nr:hypothetical protein COLO4_23255 [Corchorus olitorius]